MRRREFITLLGGTVAWSFTARAQQSATTVIGFLAVGEPPAVLVEAFRRGLNEAGSSQNFAIE
jgi:hypothetical protein